MMMGAVRYGLRSGRTTVQVYEDNGCLYYEEVTP